MSLASAATPAPAHGRRLTLDQARQYMVDLVNRDRATAGLPPVELDEGPATRAGQGHAEDMAAHGYLSHWGTDGSVPEERFTRAGGVDMVMENASCYMDARARTLDPDARIDARLVEDVEGMFFHERPPNDGHRRNILTRWHNRLGIGVAQPLPTPGEIPVPCFAQEFVDAYGSHTPVPRAARVGARLHVAGVMNASATFAGIGLARIDPARPIDVSELNRRSSYPVPPPYVTFWPAGYRTPIPVSVSGSRFAIDVPLDDGHKAGRYEVSVWARLPGSADLLMLSLRTIAVE